MLGDKQRSTTYLGPADQENWALQTFGFEVSKTSGFGKN